MENSSEQEVILWIGPLGKLGRFESAADFFVYIALISLLSGPILSITSWYDKILHALYLNSVIPNQGDAHTRVQQRGIKGAAKFERTVFDSSKLS
jgi:hypothetical protein